MRAILTPVAVALALAGCGASSSSTGSLKQSADVKAGDSTCELSTKAFTTGTISLNVTNVGNDTTEVYVYGKGSSGSFDKVVGEAENIAPGTSRTFEVKAGGGTYEVACKPGQKGDGIRTAMEVSGDAAKADTRYDREVDVQAKDDGFTGLTGFTAKVGEKIEFKLKNQGTKRHELEVFGPDGKVIGEIGPTEPGKDGEVILTLAVAGTYTYESGIADDAAKGLKGTFTVTP
jgi:iron uptake system component EfeO